MTDAPRPRQLTMGAPVRTLDMGAKVRPVPSDLDAARAERRRLYRTARWRQRRAAFLARNPLCSEPGCHRPALAVDHVDGHQHTDWRERFWNESRWAGLCDEHHGAKTRGEQVRWARTGGGVPR